VSGLTSAASVWVVASIGMAAGAGLYATAGIGAAIVIVALEFVGFAERRGNIKGFPLVYEARGRDQSEMLASILCAMDSAGERLGSVERDVIGEMQRVSFSLTAKRKQHELILGKLATDPAIEALHTYRDPEED
jgi:putative Mg2+ transporter-C (MgtC) family protein